jgi:hypothetical protein
VQGVVVVVVSCFRQHLLKQSSRSVQYTFPESGIGYHSLPNLCSHDHLSPLSKMSQHVGFVVVVVVVVVQGVVVVHGVVVVVVQGVVVVVQGVVVVVGGVVVVVVQGVVVVVQGVVVVVGVGVVVSRSQQHSCQLPSGHSV